MNDTPQKIVLQVLEGNDPVTFSPLQQFIMEHIHSFELAWWAIFVIVVARLLYVLYTSYSRR